VIRPLRSCAGLFVVALISISACDSKTPTPTAPTPTPTAPATPAPPPPPPPAPAALESITLSDSSVTGQAKPVATVKLTAPAPAGNASIAVESTNSDVAKVPANISVAAGETSNSFAIDTSTVGAPTTVTISARYEGVTMTAALTVRPPPLVPNFSVTSPTRGGDACGISTAAGAVDCQFDASASSGFIATYRWTLTLAGKELNLNMPEGSAVFSPATDCTFLSGGSPSSEGTLSMVVVLRLEDRQGNITNPIQRTVTVYPNALCGY
jgi:hypothetical protein